MSTLCQSLVMSSSIVIMLLSVILSVSDSGKRLIKKYEGLELEAYYCASGQRTIGYGHTSSNLDKITESQADSLLQADLEVIEEYLNNNYDFNQNEFDAVASFIYNIGIYKFSTSTFSRTLDSSELQKWVYADGKYLAGLKARRDEEINLYNTPIYNDWWLQVKDAIYPNYWEKWYCLKTIKIRNEYNETE